MSGAPYKLKGEKRICDTDDGYTTHITATLDDCYNHCKRDGADHFSYGRKGKWACSMPDGCKCWCFLKDCVEKENDSIDLYVGV